MIPRILGHCYKEAVDVSGFPSATVQQQGSLCDGIVRIQGHCSHFAKVSGLNIYSAMMEQSEFLETIYKKILLTQVPYCMKPAIVSPRHNATPWFQKFH